MFKQSIWVLLFSTIGLFSAEKYVIKKHNIVEKKGKFFLCTNSGNAGVNGGIFSIENNKPKLLLSTYVKNEEIQNFTETVTALIQYLQKNYDISIQYACFSGPGVPSAEKDYLEHTRLPYVINAKEIIAQNNLASAIIVNDFLAMSYGVNFVDNDQITTIYEAQPAIHGNRVIIGAGAGLGTVSMVWNDQLKSYTSFPAEAGTGDFPPFDAFELDLVDRMKKLRNFKTMHWAFFVAEPGIEKTYQILQDMNYENCASDKKYDNAIAILNNASNDACCTKTADLFYKFYARFVYNFVWNILPFGGIYLVGKTATSHPELLKSKFLPAYFDCVESKRPLLQRIPIYIINDDIATELYGTAQYFLLEKKELLSDESFFDVIQAKVTGMWDVLKK